MAQPEYKLSAPNTGSYQLAPQASPVSVYTRPKQADPSLTDYKAQVESFQNFVTSMVDWRQAENKDNQEKAQLRALADDARGELDDSLEAEDEDYQKYGRFLQGKNYAKDVGSKLVTEITVGFEGKPGLMDQAFAETKLPENADRKVEDIFSELLEDRKDHYRDQVPDSSDEFYSGFGEAMQPFANEINKAFYKKVQKETYSDRRENFSQGLIDQVKKDIRLIKDEAEGSENIIFNQAYLREFAADNGIAAGLSEDAALGEAIRVWSQELREVIDGADSEEDLEIANDMLAVFYTDIKSKNGVKGRARLISIPLFQKEAGQLYVSLGNAKDAKRKEIEADAEKDKQEERDRQEIDVIASLVKGEKLGDLKTFRKNYPNLKPEDYYQLLKLENGIKDRGKKDDKVVTDPIVFGDAFVASKNGSLTRAKALAYYITDKSITKEDYKTLISNIETNTKISKPVRDYIEGRLVDVELEKLPLLFRGQGGLANFEQMRPNDYRAFKRSLLDLKLKIYDSTDKHLKDNNLELTTENQIKIMDKVLEDLQPDIEKHNKLMQRFSNEEVAKTASTKPPEEIKPLIVPLSETASIGISAEKLTRYFKNTDEKKSGLNLYNDYFDFTLSVRGAGMALDKEDNIFASLVGTNEEKRKAGKILFVKLQKNYLPKENWPVGEDNKGMTWVQWVRGAIDDEIAHMTAPIDKALKDAFLTLHQDVFGKKGTPPEASEQEPSLLELRQKYSNP